MKAGSAIRLFLGSIGSALATALQTARVLVANMSPGTDQQSPWPFRADYRTGAPRGEVGANQSDTLRLFDKLISLGQAEFQPAHDQLWRWIKQMQIPNAAKDGQLWVQFF